MKITTLKLKDRYFDNWHTEIEDHWNYSDMLAHEDWRKDWISFDCLCYDKDSDTVFCGITSFAADIFWGYNRRDRHFVTTGYERIADPYDAKFHRALVKDDEYLYGAVALLHDIDRYWDAPGGAIVRYNPRNNEIKKLGFPIPHVYIQSIILDERRGIIYGQTFTPERFFSFDLETRKSRDIGPIGSGMVMAQGENLVLDDKGNVWGAWGVTRAWQSFYGKDGIRLFCYNFKKGSIDYLTTGLLTPDGSHGYAKPEAFFNFKTGCLYASGSNGSIYRIDPKTGKTEYLFTPIPDRPSRLASLAIAPDGFAYGVTGRNGQTELLKFDPNKEKYELLGKVIDKNGITCWQAHDIVSLPGGILYVAENDVPTRSGYLWEISM